ncbi:glycosyltransferase family 4 protein [Patescibacteria group bacterium]
MRAGIYSPYWDTLGGGEYYASNFARSVVHLGYQVDLLSNNTNLIDDLESRFGINLDGVVINKSANQKFSKSILEKRTVTKNYDLFFFVSDGSIPFLFSKNNILHFQVPFHNVGGKKFINKIKLSKINNIVCNSKFTKKVIDSEFGADSKIIYPAVKKITPSKKENVILSVGRFDNLMQSKRQDVLISAFKKLNKKNWKLVLAGGVLHGDEYVNKLREEAKGLNIEIKTNLSYKNLKTLYSKAKIFWHAAGYDLDVAKNPEKAEHFGISTVEAMSAESIPIVYNAGGLKEIVSHNKTGYLWSTVDELVLETQKVIKSEPKILENVVKKSQQFSQGVFDECVKKIVS